MRHSDEKSTEQEVSKEKTKVDELNLLYNEVLTEEVSKRTVTGCEW